MPRRFLKGTQVKRLRALRREGLSYRHIGRLVGCADTTVAYHTRDIIIVKPIGRPPHPAELVREMRAMRRGGAPVMHIAALLGVHSQTVSKYTRDLAVRLVGGRPARPEAQQRRIFAARADGVSRAAMAERFGFPNARAVSSFLSRVGARQRSLGAEGRS